MSTVSPHFLGIHPKMYRHFAMATVTISAIIAIFADGESQEAVARNERHTEMKQAEEERFGKTRLIDKRDDGGKRRSSGGGFNGEFGAPMDGSSSGGGNSSFIPANMILAPSPIVIEPDQKAMAKMTAAQRKAYLKRLEEERARRMNGGPVLPTTAQLSALAAASAARSGSDGID